jgi:hypothetical protein
VVLLHDIVQVGARADLDRAFPLYSRSFRKLMFSLRTRAGREAVDLDRASSIRRQDRPKIVRRSQMHRVGESADVIGSTAEEIKTIRKAGLEPLTIELFLINGTLSHRQSAVCGRSFRVNDSLGNTIL